MHKCASVDAMAKQTRQFGERAMLFSIKNHHICGKSARKNHSKTHHVVAKNKIASMFAPPFVAPSKRPLRNYTKCAQRTILQKWKGAIDEWANQWYNSYINEVNYV